MSEVVEGQKVKVYLSMCGDYCSFHECEISVVYDVTNDIQLEDETLEEIKTIIEENDNWCDYQECDAIKVGGTYYYNF
jgi:hypothetical protein